MMVAVHNTGKFADVWAVLDTVMDPEVPVVSVVDLGIVRDVIGSDSAEKVIITPTYSGCPATQQIESDIRQALDDAGFARIEIETRLSPAWTTDWMSQKGRAALADFGIAPPEGKAACGKPSGRKGVSARLFAVEKHVTCPHCQSRQTHLVSEFGSTACKALWKCDACGEPFDYFKCI